MSKSKKRGPVPEVLKVEGDIGRVLDRMLGKYGPPPKAAKKNRKRTARKAK